MGGLHRRGSPRGQKWPAGYGFAPVAWRAQLANIRFVIRRLMIAAFILAVLSAPLHSAALHSAPLRRSHRCSAFQPTASHLRAHYALSFASGLASFASS